LTGIANRRRFDRYIDYLWDKSLKENETLSLLLMDIDHFKLYNDNYGHSEGDECLKQVANILANSIRPTDKVARYGGEEFVVLLPNTNREQALVVVNRILSNIRSKAILHEYSKVADIVTMSIGLSCNQPRQSSYKSLIEDADTALYKVKESTRNGSAFYNSLTNDS
jgi:diguanylate cyclase (GGDEF)-like protein